ncbi:MAG: uridine kinase [Acidobacteriota bacterium]
MAGARPYLIGIAGPSCAGKSELARRLAALLRAQILALDSYYVDLAHLPFEERCLTNFDEPAALDHELLFGQVALLAAGVEVEKPVYDFTRHIRTAATGRLAPGEFLIIEGLFTLYWEGLRALFATKVFVAAPDEICFERRRERDVRERARTPESILEQYTRTVRPMAARYILPTREFADLVVSGIDPLERSLAAVLAHIESRRR